MEFKRKIADLYLENKQKMEELDPETLVKFASGLLRLIEGEKQETQPSHDLGVLEQSMKHLKDDSTRLKNLKPNADDYNFTRSDCRNLVNSTKNWLIREGLI